MKGGGRLLDGPFTLLAAAAWRRAAFLLKLSLFQFFCPENGAKPDHVYYKSQSASTAKQWRNSRYICSFFMKSQTVYLSVPQSFCLLTYEVTAGLSLQSSLACSRLSRSCLSTAVITVEMSCHVSPGRPGDSDAQAQLMQNTRKQMSHSLGDSAMIER